MPKTKDALKIIDRMVGQDKELRDMIAVETVNVCVARMIYDARNKAGLTQKGLAKVVGTTQSVIARLEDADISVSCPSREQFNTLDDPTDFLSRHPLLFRTYFTCSA